MKFENGKYHRIKKIPLKTDIILRGQSIGALSLLKSYESSFIVYRHNNTDKAHCYILGLLKYEKSHTNMERMTEEVPELAYHQYHNFLSESRWHWDGKEQEAQVRTLIITKTEEANPRIKFSFTNGTPEQYTQQQYAYFQCNRYWEERSFDDAKNEQGLSGHQVLK